MNRKDILKRGFFKRLIRDTYVKDREQSPANVALSRTKNAPLTP